MAYFNTIDICDLNESLIEKIKNDAIDYADKYNINDNISISIRINSKTPEYIIIFINKSKNIDYLKYITNLNNMLIDIDYNKYCYIKYDHDCIELFKKDYNNDLLVITEWACGDFTDELNNKKILKQSHYGINTLPLNNGYIRL